jgi:hypothetical protein
VIIHERALPCPIVFYGPSGHTVPFPAFATDPELDPALCECARAPAMNYLSFRKRNPRETLVLSYWSTDRLMEAPL